ncbi:MAG: hypothetical protein WCO45_10960 [Pseudanabaena sp. ELA607]
MNNLTYFPEKCKGLARFFLHFFWGIFMALALLGISAPLRLLQDADNYGIATKLLTFILK